MSGTVNITDVFHVAQQSSMEMTTTLKFYGKTPGGKDIEVKIVLYPWTLGHTAEQIHKALNEHTETLKRAKSRAAGECL